MSRASESSKMSSLRRGRAQGKQVYAIVPECLYSIWCPKTPRRGCVYSNIWPLGVQKDAVFAVVNLALHSRCPSFAEIFQFVFSSFVDKFYLILCPNPSPNMELNVVSCSWDLSAMTQCNWHFLKFDTPKNFLRCTQYDFENWKFPIPCQYWPNCFHLWYYLTCLEKEDFSINYCTS